MAKTLNRYNGVVEITENLLAPNHKGKTFVTIANQTTMSFKLFRSHLVH